MLIRTVTALCLSAAALAAQTVYYPGVASAPGANGTQWRTQVVLFNPSDRIQDTVLAVRPFGSTASAHSRQYRLGAGETLGISDLYADLGAGSGAGVLEVEGPFLAWVRTYNQGEGTFGQNIPPVDPESGYGAGTRVHFPLRVPASVATDFRSNLLLFNLSTRIVHFTLQSGDRTMPLDLPGGVALLVDNVGGRLGLPPGPAPLTVSADGTWTGFVSTADPALGDPTTVEGLVEPAGEGVRFPGVASAIGANMTRWRSELDLYNPGPGPTTAHLVLTPLGSSEPGIPLDYPLNDEELLFISDLYAFFGADDGAGVLTVEGRVMAWVRTFNLGDQGTFGQNIPAWGVGIAWEADTEVLFPLQTARHIATDFRSNLMLVNPLDIDLHFEMWTESVYETLDLPAGTGLLLDSLGDRMGSPPGLSTLAVKADGPWVGFVSTVDPALGDPTTVEGLPRP